jgi:hypothetical protein
MTEEECGKAAMQGLIDYLGDKSLVYRVHKSVDRSQLAEVLPILRRSERIGEIVIPWSDIAAQPSAEAAYDLVRGLAHATIQRLVDPQGNLREPAKVT